MKKDKTFSMSRDGIVYIQVQLNDELNNKDEFWSKFKHGVSTFKAQLPKNVLAVQVMDDFWRYFRLAHHYGKCGQDLS